MELQSSRPLLSFLYLLPLCFELLMWRLFCVFHVCECLHRGINPLAAEHCFRRWFERLTCVFGWAAALQRWCLGCDADLVVLFLAVVCSNCGFCSERSVFLFLSGTAWALCLLGFVRLCCSVQPCIRLLCRHPQIEPCHVCLVFTTCTLSWGVWGERILIVRCG